MPDNVVGTTIRIGADTGQAEVALSRVQRGFEVMQSRTMPALQSSFAGTSRYAIAMSGALQSVGLQGEMLRGPLGAIAYGLGAINPALLAVATAGGLVAGILLRNRDETEKLTETTKKYIEQMAPLIALQNQYGAFVRQRTMEMIQENRETISTTKNRIAETEALIAAGGKYEKYALAVQFGTIAGIRQTKSVSDLKAELDKLYATLGDVVKATETLTGRLYETGFKAATGDVEKHKETVAKLRDQIDELALEYSVWPKQVSGIIRQMEYDLIGERMIWGGMTQAEWIARANIASAKILQIEKNRLNKSEALVRNYESVVQSMLLQRVSLQKSIGLAMVSLVGDEVAGELEKRAKLWAAQALAAAASMRWGSAALYAAAAAAAGAGAAAIRAEVSGSQERASGGAGGGIGEGGGAGTVGSGTIERGRTVISQGPITLNYSAVFSVAGNIYDTGDLRRLWSQWNQDQLRSAGLDAVERAKG
jgi:hypothetical protein